MLNQTVGFLQETGALAAADLLGTGPSGDLKSTQLVQTPFTERMEQALASLGPLSAPVTAQPHEPVEQIASGLEITSAIQGVTMPVHLGVQCAMQQWVESDPVRGFELDSESESVLEPVQLLNLDLNQIDFSNDLPIEEIDKMNPGIDAGSAGVSATAQVLLFLDQTSEKVGSESELNSKETRFEFSHPGAGSKEDLNALELQSQVFQNQAERDKSLIRSSELAIGMSQGFIQQESKPAQNSKVRIETGVLLQSARGSLPVVELEELSAVVDPSVAMDQVTSASNSSQVDVQLVAATRIGKDAEFASGVETNGASQSMEELEGRIELKQNSNAELNLSVITAITMADLTNISESTPAISPAISTFRGSLISPGVELTQSTDSTLTVVEAEMATEAPVQVEARKSTKRAPEFVDFKLAKSNQTIDPGFDLNSVQSPVPKADPQVLSSSVTVVSPSLVRVAYGPNPIAAKPTSEGVRRDHNLALGDGVVTAEPQEVIQTLLWLKQSKAFTDQLRDVPQSVPTVQSFNASRDLPLGEVQPIDFKATELQFNTVQVNTLQTSSVQSSAIPLSQPFASVGATSALTDAKQDLIEQVKHALKIIEMRLPGQVEVGFTLGDGERVSLQIQTQGNRMDVALEGLQQTIADSLIESSTHMSKLLETMGYQVQSLKINGEAVPPAGSNPQQPGSNSGGMAQQQGQEHSQNGHSHSAGGQQSGQHPSQHSGRQSESRVDASPVSDLTPAVKEANSGFVSMYV